MHRKLLLLGALALWSISGHAQTMTFSISQTEFVTTPAFSNVVTFDFDIEINAPLAAGVYTNPEIVNVSYRVSGDLVSGTPSTFPSFALERIITGTEFYAQGSSLNFEIAASAVLSDGIQVAELVGTAVVFTFNGRENGNGRFHPALFELRADGTGRIQNSDNIVTSSPLQQVSFGEEYITDLMFDAGNTTLLTSNAAPVPPTPPTVPPTSSGGSGAPSLWILLALLSVVHGRQRHLNKPTCSA